MAIITYEGFENYSSFNAVKSFVGLDNYQTVTILNSSDGIVTPRNNLSCIKMVSSAGGQSGGTGSNNTYYDGVEYYPKAMIQTPNNTGYNSSIVGFAWYATKPAAGSWANFTPIAAFCDVDGKPHFFVGINKNLQLQVRRWVTGISAGGNKGNNTTTYSWNTNPDGNDYRGDYNCGRVYYNYFISTIANINVHGCATGSLASRNSAIDLNKFILLGSTSSLVTENAWNYIEVKFVLDNTTNTGSIQLKLNRNSYDSFLDINVSNIRTSTQANSLCSKVAFGIFWGHNSDENGSSASLGWTTYIDDIYWLDLTGTDNNFLGRVSCKKFSYNTVVNYDMTTPANSGTALTNFNETYSGAGTLSTVNVGNLIGQTLDVKSTGVSSETLNPINVRHYVHGYKTDVSSDISIGATDGVNTIESSGMKFNNDRFNGTFKFRDYNNAPDGNEWTNEKIANTIFKHTIVSAT